MRESTSKLLGGFPDTRIRASTDCFAQFARSKGDSGLLILIIELSGMGFVGGVKGWHGWIGGFGFAGNGLKS